MLPRAVAVFFLALAAASSARAQEAVASGLPNESKSSMQTAVAPSAWLDLRQTAAANSAPQSAPAWVEVVTLVPVAAKGTEPAHTIFRIRVARPRAELQLLLFRLFFEDKRGAQPLITAWDESGTQILRSSQLGSGTDLQTSDTVILPMLGVSAIDVEVAGDGKTVRGAYLDWMTSRTVAHPLAAGPRDVIPEPFAASAPLHAPAQDEETFGTVTATLAPETIRIGETVT
ncbi:MAG: hypothetical protein M3Y86_07475, partial [Verrucomicrobiota bacterium]|nr:hypothetical protein [Verrucomicrobiota bacterium]